MKQKLCIELIYVSSMWDKLTTSPSMNLKPRSASVQRVLKSIDFELIKCLSPLRVSFS